MAECRAVGHTQQSSREGRILADFAANVGRGRRRIVHHSRNAQRNLGQRDQIRNARHQFFRSQFDLVHTVPPPNVSAADRNS
jgi:hypothetical protein